MASLAPATQQRAAIYCRVSTQEQSDRGYSLDAQLDDCRKLAAELGARVVAEHRDTDSGAAWDLPGLNALLDAAKRREFDLVLVYDPDRLARRMAKQLVLEEELTRSGVSLRYVTLRIGDSAEDRLMKNVRSSIAEYEREKITLRTSRGRRAKAERGLYVGLGGVAPYGYILETKLDDTQKRYVIVGLTPDPATAPVVRRIFRDALTLSSADIAAQLTAEGIPSLRRRDRWTVIGVYGILCNPAYKGEATYGRTKRGYRSAMQTGIVIPVPALLSPDDWDAVQTALKARRISRRGRYLNVADDPYELRGRLFCAHCGGLIAIHAKHGRRYYLCGRHDTFQIRKSGWEHCPLPALLAAGVEGNAAGVEGVEGNAWKTVTSALLDPERLRRGFALQQELHAEERDTRRLRLEILDGEIAKHERTLRRAVQEKLKVDP